MLFRSAIPVVSAYIGTTQVGWAIGTEDAVKLTQASALQLTVLSYVAMLAGVAVMGAFIHWMARTYDASPSFNDCVIFAAYTATPLFVAGLAALYPSFLQRRWCCLFSKNLLLRRRELHLASNFKSSLEILMVKEVFYFKTKKAVSCDTTFLEFGSSCWARTSDLRINSPSLYQLS